MAMGPPPARRNAFGDPRSGWVYVWQRNHEEEQAGARVRAIDNVQPARGRWQTLRAIRTQSSRDELVYKLAGKVPTLAQHAAFLYFMDLSLRQTIVFWHAAGEKFECLLSDYEPQRQYTPGGRENYLWVYTVQLDVIQHFTYP